MGGQSDARTGACGRHVEVVSWGHVSGNVLGVYTEDVNVCPDAELPADAATEPLDYFLRKLVGGGHSGNRANSLLWMFLWGSGDIATGAQPA